MAQPDPMSHGEIRKHVIQDSDARLRSELRRVFPNFDTSMVDDMSRDQLVNKVTELRMEASVHTALKKPIVGVSSALTPPVTPSKTTVVQPCTPAPAQVRPTAPAPVHAAPTPAQVCPTAPAPLHDAPAQTSIPGH